MTATDDYDHFRTPDEEPSTPVEATVEVQEDTDWDAESSIQNQPRSKRPETLLFPPIEPLKQLDVQPLQISEDVIMKEVTPVKVIPSDIDDADYYGDYPAPCKKARSWNDAPAVKPAAPNAHAPAASGPGLRSLSAAASPNLEQPLSPLKYSFQVKNNNSLEPSSPMCTGRLTRKKAPLPPTRPAIRRTIYFYNREDPHYGFTNFSPHTVSYKGKVYPSSEHLFQSFKFLENRPNLAEHIRTFSDRPSVALSEARRFQPEVRKDWKDVNVEKMDETLWHKFSQHPDLKQELLDTGDASLVEDSDRDSFWGVGANRQGRNELGKALERLRHRFREEMAHSLVP